MILGLSQELQKNPQDEVKSHALTIERQGKGLLTLINQLLDMGIKLYVQQTPTYQSVDIDAKL